MVLFDYIRVWQTRSSETINTIKYRLYARSKINISEMKDYLNEIIKISTKNKELRSKYIRMNNKVTELRDLLSNLLDWYYETIITIKREMMVNTYELLLNDEISSEEIEQNLAIYFDISSNMRSNDDNFEFDNYEDEEKIDLINKEDSITQEDLLKFAKDNLSLDAYSLIYWIIKRTWDNFHRNKPSIKLICEKLNWERERVIRAFNECKQFWNTQGIYLYC